MKRTMLLSLLVLVTVSCSDEVDNEMPDTLPIITNIVNKSYDTSTIPKTVEDSLNISVINNKMSTYAGIHLINNEEYNGIYNYKQDRISEIVNFTDGELRHRTNFEYDSFGNLIEFKEESISLPSKEKLYTRHRFNHESDTIFAVVERSVDNINYNTLSDLKIVLDTDDNRVYFEDFNQLSNTTKVFKSTYDNRSNLIKEEIFDLEENVLKPDLITEMTYDTSINTLNRINQETFSKRTLMLTYHIRPSALNGFTPRLISPNNMVSLDSNFSDVFRFEIANTINASNFSEINEFDILADDQLFISFSREFYFSQ